MTSVLHNWQKCKDVQSGSIYWANRTTGQVSMFPPLQTNEHETAETKDDVEMTDAEEATTTADPRADHQNAGDQRTLFDVGTTNVPPQPTIGTDGIAVAEVHPGRPAVPIVEQPKKAVDYSFDPRSKTGNKNDYSKDDLVQHCKDFHLDWSGLRPELELRLRNHFVKMHEQEGTMFFESNAFVPQRQKIDRKRVLPSALRKRTGGTRGVAADPNSKRSKKKTKTYHMKPKLALQEWPDQGLIIVEHEGEQRTACTSCRGSHSRNGTSIGHTLIHGSKTKHKRHIDGKEHVKNNETRINSKKVQSSIDSTLTEEDKETDVPDEIIAHRRRWFRVCVQRGIAPEAMFGTGHDNPGLTNVIEDAHGDGTTLTVASMMMKNHVGPCLQLEQATAKAELKGKPMSLICDETPRQGDIAANIGRYVYDPDDYLQSSSSSSSSSTMTTTARCTRSCCEGKYWQDLPVVEDDCFLGQIKNPNLPSVEQRLFFVDFFAKSPSANQLVSSLNLGLVHVMEKPWKSVKASMSDGAAVNIDAFAKLNELQGVCFFVILCFAHMFSNAGKEISLIHVDLLWSHLQAVFGHSDAARDLWSLALDGKAWISYNAIRWWSKYLVLQSVVENMDVLITVISQCVARNIAPKSASNLLNLLTNPASKHYVKIEATAYLKISYDFFIMTYKHEGNQQQVFDFAPDLDDALDKFANGNISWNILTDVTDLFEDAITWAGTSEEVAAYDAAAAQFQVLNGTPAPIPAIRSRAAIERANPRPRRRAARGAAAASIANLGAHTAAGKAALERQQQLERADAEAEIAWRAKIQEERLKVAKALQKCPPRDEDGWKKHIEDQFKDFIEYICSRTQEGGDRFEALEVFRGAVGLNPIFATMSKNEHSRRIDQLSHYPEMTDAILTGLKSEQQSYLDDARRTPVGRGVNVLHWHFHHRHARPFFWKAAKLLVLLQPTSAAAERVFSVVTKRFGNLCGNYNALADYIRLSLMMAFNKRRC